MRTTMLSLLAAAVVGLAACGSDDDDEAAAPATTQEAKQASAGPFPSDPYEITCAHMKDSTDTEVAKGSRRATFALADDTGIDDVSRLQVAESIFFAMTDLCKKNPGSFKPAKDAVAGVKSGKYEADLGKP